MNSFQDKVVWITGASSGYGAALARAFDTVGAKLILSARREESLREFAQTLQNARALPLDLSKPETFQQACTAACKAFGHVDIIIHAGAIAQNGSAMETRPEVAREIMNVDYFSYTELTRHILPHFIERNSGHIVVISGLIIAFTAPGRSSYAAAKAALLGYFGCLRAELAGKNINVTVLIPGAMQTDFAAKAVKADGSRMSGTVTSDGCSVDDAARQSLEAIARNEYQAFVGDAQNKAMWEAYLRDPNQAIAMLLQQIKNQGK